MKLTNIFSAAALAVALPFAASAATININNGDIEIDFVDPATLDPIDIDVLATADVNVTFESGDKGGVLVFSLNNVGETAAAFTVVGGTVDQGLPNYGFAEGVSIWLANPDPTEVPQVGESFDFTTTIAAGGSAVFSFDYGTPFGIGEVFPDIDFTVFATPVPIPAAGFLLLGALGGLAATRRRKS